MLTTTPKRLLLAALALHLAYAPVTLRGDDCDLDGADDAGEIAAGRIADCNDNGIPDDCELQPRRFRARALPLDGRPRRVAAADLDGDGRLDIVTIRRTIVNVLLNGAADPFAEVHERVAGDPLDALALADVDGDGFPDVIAADLTGLRTLRNSGDGRLEAPLGLDLSGVVALSAIDLDGDPFMDLAALRTGSLTLLAASGDGEWSRFRDDVALPGAPAQLATGDLEGDGDMDLLIAAGEAALVAWNRGLGAFTVESVAELADGARNVALANVDGDGLVDAVAVTNDAIHVLHGAPEGFRAGVEVYLPGGALDPDLFAAGDLDGDGDEDVVAGQAGGASLLALHNAGRRLASAETIDLPEPALDLVLADVAGDGGADLVSAAADSRLLLLLTGEDEVPDAAAKLGLAPFTFAVVAEFEPHSTVAADFDGDGDSDLATMDGEDRVLVVYGDGHGGLDLGEPFTVAGTDEIIALAAADLDGDSDADLAAVDERLNVLALLFNRGDGTFAQGETHDLDGQPFQVHAADLSGDGLPELISVNEGDGTLEVFHNGGGGELELETTLAVGDGARWAASGDFDDDGDLDLAAVAAAGDALVIFENDGAGGLAAHDDLAVSAPAALAAADMDGDGDLDLVVASETGEQVSLFANDGDGAFVLAVEVALGRGAHSVIVADVDGDGHADVITANPGADSLSVLLGREGGLAAPLELPAGGEPRFAVAADLDEDGRADLVSANHDTHDLTVFLHGAGAPLFRTRICSESEFHDVSAASAAPAIFTVPAAPDPPATPPPCFQDMARFPTHEAFLAVFFPELVAAGGYSDLALGAGTRRYLSGDVRRLATAMGPLYGFTVFTDEALGVARPATRGEVEETYARLGEIFHLAPLYYAPASDASRAEARAWIDPAVPLLLDGEPAGTFRRGDPDGNGHLDLADVLVALNFLFLSGPAPDCLDAADASDDGEIDLTDAVVLLSYLFLGSRPLAPPAPGCGRDPTADRIPCAVSAACR